MHRFDVADFARSHPLPAAGSAGISAWALSSDGALVALGDFEGRVFLLDTASGKSRALPIERGSEITWVAFSEDDAWLATGSRDGTVHAFVVATGDSLASGRMAHDFPVRRVGISRAQRVLLVAGEGRSAIWRLPQPGPRAVPAQRIGLAPAPHGLAGRFPIGWSLRTGLLASAGIDGQLRLWRLPAAPTLDARAAPQIPERTYYHPGRVVDVAWDQVRIASPAGASLGPWLRLPQPPGFAELLDAGRLLLLTTGPELRIVDAKSMRLRFPPLPLPATPERLLANADGSRIVLCFGESGATGFRERLMVFDARRGRRLPGEATLPGPLRRLAFSADDRRLLALGAPDGSSSVLAVDQLRTIASYPHDPYEPVMWADFANTGKDILLLTRAADSRLGADTLVTWNPEADRDTTRELPAQSRPLAILGTDGGAFVAGQAQDIVVSQDGRAQAGVRLAQSEAIAQLALSPDGRLLARAFRREVQLFDPRSGVAIGRPLQADGNAMDLIAQLAFAPDGGSLLGRTVQGHWLLWPIAARAAGSHLAEALPALRADREEQHVARMPRDAERRLLRSDDTGAWRAPQPRPTPPMAAGVKGRPIPARAAGTDETMLDLTSAYNFDPEWVGNSYYNIRPTMRPLPPGVQRFDGHDFDLRGLAQIGVAKPAPEEDIFRGVQCLPLPARRFSALRPLMSVSAPAPVATGALVASFVLHYRDGSQASLPVRAGLEVRGYSGDDAAVPLAFAGDRALALLGLQDDVLVAPRLPNPHPERAASCIDIHAEATAMPILLMAVTLEDPAPAGGGQP